MSRNVVIVVFFILISAIVFTNWKISKTINRKQKFVYRVKAGIVSILTIGIFLVYVVLGEYDKMGNRRSLFAMHYYTEDKQEYVLLNDRLQEVEKTDKTYDIKNAYINWKGYLVFLDEEKVTCIDEENHFYRDREGKKYIKLEFVSFDFSGYPYMN